MREEVRAYLDAVSVVENHWNTEHEGRHRVIDSVWCERPNEMLKLDRRFGIEPDDPEVYSIGAFKRDLLTLGLRYRRGLEHWIWSDTVDGGDVDEYSSSQPFDDAQLLALKRRASDCYARHFASVRWWDNSFCEPDELLSYPASARLFWAYITDQLLQGLGRYYALYYFEWREWEGSYFEKKSELELNKMLDRVHGHLIRGRTEIAPAPPYRQMSKVEVEHTLIGYLNRLEKDDAARAEHWRPTERGAKTPGRKRKPLTPREERIISRWGDGGRFKDYAELRDALREDDGIVASINEIEKILNRIQQQRSRERRKNP